MEACIIITNFLISRLQVHDQPILQLGWTLIGESDNASLNAECFPSQVDMLGILLNCANAMPMYEIYK